MYLSNDISIRRTARACRVHKRDRQTDHAREKCIAIGGIAFTAARNDSAFKNISIFYLS